jgi:hypothetical protein
MGCQIRGNLPKPSFYLLGDAAKWPTGLAIPQYDLAVVLGVRRADHHSHPGDALQLPQAPGRRAHPGHRRILVPLRDARQRGRTLTFEDIRHVQKIIVALLETDRIMQEIDAVGAV